MGPRRGLHWEEGTVRIRGRRVRCGEGASRVRGPVLPILQQTGPGSPGRRLTRHREGLDRLGQKLNLSLANL